jgi:hypothetical protein
MAVRVTSAEVLDIMDNCTMPTTVVDALIVSANAFINKAFENDTEMTEVMLKEVERWLTAHMIACTDIYRVASKERLGDAEVSYTGEWGKMLDSTPYGQMVKTLDVTGILARAGRRGASIYAVPRSEW